MARFDPNESGNFLTRADFTSGWIRSVSNAEVDRAKIVEMENKREAREEVGEMLRY